MHHCIFDKRANVNSVATDMEIKECKEKLGSGWWKCQGIVLKTDLVKKKSGKNEIVLQMS